MVGLVTKGVWIVFCLRALSPNSLSGSAACSSRTCKNGACRLNRCKCFTGWSGTNCDRKNYCLSQPCLNGECTSLSSSYTCTCMEGWTGRNCNERINICPSDACVNGVCRTSSSGYHCDCFAGWAGEDCGYPVSDCPTTPCVNGECEEYRSDHYCECDTGWAGVNCSVVASDCPTTPCINGECEDSGTDHYCECYAGWAGVDCNQVVSDCLTTPCTNGECEESGSDNYCKCYPGWAGVICNQDIPTTTAGNPSNTERFGSDNADNPGITGPIVGGVVALVVLIALGILVIVFCRRVKKKKNSRDTNDDVRITNPESEYQGLHDRPDSVISSANVYTSIKSEDMKSYFAQNGAKSSIPKTEDEEVYIDIASDDTEDSSKFSKPKSTTSSDSLVDDSRRNMDRLEAHTTVASSTTQAQPSVMREANQEVGEQSDDYFVPEEESNQETTEKDVDACYPISQSKKSEASPSSPVDEEYSVITPIINSYEKPDNANYSEIEPAHGSNHTEQSNDGNCTPEQDQYGYSHMTSGNSTVPIHGGTYAHTPKTNEDDFGYSHSPDGTLYPDNWKNDPEYSHTTNVES